MDANFGLPPVYPATAPSSVNSISESHISNDKSGVEWPDTPPLEGYAVDKSYKKIIE